MSVRNKIGKRGLVAGVGINDADYPVDQKIELPKGNDGKRRRKTVFYCKIYAMWKQVLTRCYSKDYTDEKIRSYKNATVCDDWLLFSNFRKWVVTQDWEGKHIDKDLLVMGNKHYSPETCALLEPRINLFLIDGGGIGRGDLPIGASFCKRDKLIYAKIKNSLTGKREHIGTFKTPMEAHKAWQTRKHEIALQLADQQSDPRIAQALRERYTPDKDWSNY